MTILPSKANFSHHIQKSRISGNERWKGRRENTFWESRLIMGKCWQILKTHMVTLDLDRVTGTKSVLLLLTTTKL